jgi:group I intron endonuclease
MSKVIYKIVNLVNDKFYIGSTTNKKVRFRQHRKLLRGNRHHCKHLQAAWNMYGESKFDFLVVEEVAEARSLQEVEEIYLLQHVGKDYCYNSGYGANAPWRNAPSHKTPNYGRTMPDSAKATLSEATKRQWTEADPRTGTKHSEETKVLISANRVGKHAGENHYRYGKTLSEEVRAKIGDTQRGVHKSPRSEEHRRKLSEANKGNQNWLGKRHSEESRLKMSKPILELSTNTEFPSLTAVLQHFSMTMPTLRRALVSGVPISKGRFAGLQFQYAPAKKGVFPGQPGEQTARADDMQTAP